MRQALGKGLDALISEPAASIEAASASSLTTRKIPVVDIRANHLQPRKRFNDETLRELAASIKEHGLAQPILVSKSPADGYELIAGERRLRAAQLAGLTEIDCIVRPALPHLERLALALIENLQREDLNAIDEANGYRKLAQDFNMTQAQVAQAVGKSRVAIANTLRLLDLQPEIQQALEDGKISEGHGRALLMVENPGKRWRLFQLICERQLSVRQTEDYARMFNQGASKKVVEKSAEIKDIEARLQHLFGTKVAVFHDKKNNGRLVLHYFSLDDLDRILSILKSVSK